VQVQIVSLDEDTADFVSRNTFDHPYPTTKIMWIPDSVCLVYALVNLLVIYFATVFLPIVHFLRTVLHCHIFDVTERRIS